MRRAILMWQARMIDKVCPYCSRPLMKIDHYGEVLVGCIDCNRWGHPGDNKLLMELMESDLEVLRRSGGDVRNASGQAYRVW